MVLGDISTTKTKSEVTPNFPRGTVTVIPRRALLPSNAWQPGSTLPRGSDLSAEAPTMRITVADVYPHL